MPGPTPQPTNLKILRGNPGKRPLNKSEPKIPVEIPTAPAYLSPEAKRHYKKTAEDLARYGLMTKIDRDALAMYCAAWYTWKTSLLAIKREKAVKLVDGKAVRSAYISIAEKAFNQMRQIALEFGMTPASRGRLQINEPKKPGGDWADL